MKTIRKHFNKQNNKQNKNVKQHATLKQHTQTNQRTTVKQALTKTNGKTKRGGLLKKLRCSPKETGKMNTFSCYTDKSLYKLRDLWNARHPDALIQSNDSIEIHAILSRYLSRVCNKESCWLKQEFVKGKLSSDIADSFAPESPKEWKKNPNDWLSSLEILNVMKQYEKAYKCFDFIGPTPIDFDKKKLYGECVWEELCKFSLAQQIKKGKTKIGIIFNTDPHNKPGQHWMSMFINIKKQKVFFFDSVGDKAPPQVMKLVSRIKKQGALLQMNFTFDQNHPTEHQYGNTECGVYSIFFIVHMLEDKLTDHYFKTHVLKDEYMEKFRKIYFNDDL
jgi:hypothetical protein